jgi:hypothetical protein
VVVPVAVLARIVTEDRVAAAIIVGTLPRTAPDRPSR